MPLVLGWKEITLRLVLTVLAGAIIGFNRGEHGRPAGIRTTLLVCLAASLSMIEANLLLDTTGKASNSFAVLDLMRFPLGILSGMGFIGAGTILRKGSLVLGVTTAATLWFVTMMGLCFGGGQIGLGLAALGLGCITLWALKYAENFMRQDMRGHLSLTLLQAEPTDEQLQQQLTSDGCKIISWGGTFSRSPQKREIVCEIQWRSRHGSSTMPLAVSNLRSSPAISIVSWQPQGMSSDDQEQQIKPQGTPISIQST